MIVDMDAPSLVDLGGESMRGSIGDGEQGKEEEGGLVSMIT